MYWLSSTFTDTDSILSRRDALLRASGVVLWALVVAWTVLVALWIAGVRAPAWLPLPVAIVAGALAWRRLSARILPDGATLLAGRRLLGIVVSLALGGLGAGLMHELVLQGSLIGLSPWAPLLAAQLGGIGCYLACRSVLRRGGRITLAGLMDALSDE